MLLTAVIACSKKYGLEASWKKTMILRLNREARGAKTKEEVLLVERRKEA